MRQDLAGDTHQLCLPGLVFGVGLRVADSSCGPLLFSERHGYGRTRRIGPYVVKVLTDA